MLPYHLFIHTYGIYNTMEAA